MSKTIQGALMALDILGDEYLTDNAPKLGINNLSDLLLYLPRKYIDFSRVDTSLEDVMAEGREGLFRLRVERVSIDRRARPMRAVAKLSNGVIQVDASAFGEVHSWNGISRGNVVFVKGKVGTYNGRLQIKQAVVVPEFKVGKVYPEYKGVKNRLSHDRIAAGITAALRDYLPVASGFIVDSLKVPESDIVRDCLDGFSSLGEFVTAIHRPSSMDEAGRALKSAVRLNIYAIIVMTRSMSQKVFSEKSMIPVDYDRIRELVGLIPFALTNEQRHSIWDVCKDISSPYVMKRVLSGDVGCGKTMSYGVPAVYASLSGKRVVVLVPNTSLARQIVHELKTTFPEVDICLAIEGESVESLDRQMVVGTTAISRVLRDNPGYVPDLVIIDEQQKFSSSQKVSLLAEHTNVLEASATPIPKTMGGIIFAGMDVSYIEQSPVKKSIGTYVVTSEDKQRLLGKLRSIIDSGKKVCVLYPLREYAKKRMSATFSNPDDYAAIKKQLQKLKAKSVSKPDIDPDGISYSLTFAVDKDGFDKLFSKITALPGYISCVEIHNPESNRAHQKTVEDAAVVWDQWFPGRVVSVHGGMAKADVQEAIDRAKSPETSVIIASSILEIGLTFPGLEGMLVVDADRYGASALHQIRGRLVRNGGRGYFFLMVDGKREDAAEETLDRLNILVNSTKGSEVAYNDMMQRGFGELASEMGAQSGHVPTIFSSIKIKPDGIYEMQKHMQQIAAAGGA